MQFRTLVLVVGLFALLTIPATTPLFAQDDAEEASPAVILYIEEEILTVYVAAEEPISLNGFEFSITLDGETFFSRLEARFDLSRFEDGLVPPETCLIYLFDGGAQFPDVCEASSTVTVPVGVGDRFWLNEDGRRITFAITIDQVVTQNENNCPANEDTCEIRFEDTILEILPETPENGEVRAIFIPPNSLPTTPFPVQTLTSNRGEITALAWSPDGEYMVSGHDNGSLCLWTPQRSSIVDPIDCLNAAHESTITDLTWNIDDALFQFASSSRDTQIKLWTVNTDDSTIVEDAAPLVEHNNPVNSINWHPSEQRFVSASQDDGRLFIWDSDNLLEESPSRRASNQPIKARWHPSGRYIAAIDNLNSNTIRIFDGNGGLEPVVVDIYDSGVSGVDIDLHPIDGDLGVTSSDGTVRIYDYSAGEICPDSQCDSIAIAQNLTDLTTIRFSPNGELVAFITIDIVHVMEARSPYRLIDRYTLQRNGNNGVDVFLTALTWQPSSARLAASDNTGKIYIWEIGQEAPLRLNETLRWQATSVETENPDELEGAAPIIGFDWNQNGRQIALVDRNRNLSIWDVSSQERGEQYIAHTDTPLAIDWNQAQSIIATGGTGPMAIIWSESAIPSRLISDEFDDSSDISGLAFNPTGEIIAISQNEVIRMWDWRARVELNIQVFGFPIGDLAWNNLGTQLATVNESGLLTIFDVDNNTRVVQDFIREPEPGVALNTVVWSSDGERVATGSASNEVVIWRLDSGTNGRYQGATILEGHRAPVISISWSQTENEHWLVSLSEDGRVIVWDATTGQRLAQTQLETTPVQIAWSPTEAGFVIADTDGYLSTWAFQE